MRRSQLGLVVALTALAVAGRLLLVAVPNVSLTFFIVAVAGLTYGVRIGAAVGGLAMLATSAVLGLGPTALLAAMVVAGLGAVAGLLRALRFPRAEPTARTLLAAAALGVAFQVSFSVAVDSAGWFLFAWLPEGPAALPLLPIAVLAGLAFNLPAAAFQGALFAGALQPVVQALRAAGLAEAPPGPARGARMVVLAEKQGAAQPGRGG